MKTRLFPLIFLFFLPGLHAQELNCQVSIVQSSKTIANTTDIEVLNQLEEAIRQLMNETKWTKDQFLLEERINCQLQFQVVSIVQPGVFHGILQVQSSRPVYNASYNSLLLNIPDKEVTISFSRNAMLDYSPNQFRDNLTSILAFYAYYIIGMDYDAFGLKDGEYYLREAQSIVNNAQTYALANGDQGWVPNDSKNLKNNRYWIVDNSLHQLFEPLRECIYEYHRLGLDKMVENPEQGRSAIYQALNKLTRIASTRPNSPNVMLFLQAKRNELKQLFAQAPMPEKTNLVRLLKRLDPTNTEKYDDILK